MNRDTAQGFRRVMLDGLTTVYEHSIRSRVRGVYSQFIKSTDGEEDAESTTRRENGSQKPS